jgi:hypothetical protein
MKLIRKIAAGLLLFIGLPITIYGSFTLFDRDLVGEDREGTVAAIIIFGLPSTALGSWLIWELYAQNQREKAAKAQERLNQLQTTFYQLIQDQDGEISVLRLAAAAEISGEEAKAFLDDKAKEFSADFGVSDRGDVFYRFPL